jgi:hypothetical protein
VEDLARANSENYRNIEQLKITIETNGTADKPRTTSEVGEIRRALVRSSRVAVTTEIDYFRKVNEREVSLHSE